MSMQPFIRRRFIRQPFMHGAAWVLWVLMGAGAAQALELEIPAACNVGATCFVQNYVDHDKGEGYQDYRCGTLSYPDHRGTDIRLPSLREMNLGVSVLASAEGVVRSTRDGMEDRLLSEKGAASITGRECGNSVAITHTDGWETLYCHLRRGSVQVKQGDRVAAGQVLGMIGLSGATEFPHVHLQVMHHGKVIDPFTAGDIQQPCSKDATTTLWSANALKQLKYQPTGFISGGFSSSLPTLSGIVKAQFRESLIAPTAPALLFWVESYGVQAGDLISMQLLAPDGTTFASSEQRVKKQQAVSLSVIGKKNPRALTKGLYHGQFRLMRGENNNPLVKYEAEIEVK